MVPMQFQTFWMPFIWATAQGYPVFLSTQCFTCRNFIFENAFEFLFLLDLCEKIFFNAFQLVTICGLTNAPKLSLVILCYVNALWKYGRVEPEDIQFITALYKLSTNTLLFFDLLKGLFYDTVKLLLFLESKASYLQLKSLGVFCLKLYCFLLRHLCTCFSLFIFVFVCYLYILLKFTLDIIAVALIHWKLMFACLLT